MDTFQHKLMMKLDEEVEKKGYSLSVISGSDGVTMAQYVITIDEESMVGISVNPPMATKPFTLFPYNQLVTLEEVLELLP
ncbi:hypothetical protein bcgnr5369_67880 [Bacillus cereus]|nr:hypothetical protein [Bacillus cereus]